MVRLDGLILSNENVFPFNFQILSKLKLNMAWPTGKIENGREKIMRKQKSIANCQLLIIVNC